MKIYSPALNRVEVGRAWYLERDRLKYVICNAWLSSHFDIPDNTRRIWLVVRDSPTRNSIRLRLNIIHFNGLIVNDSYYASYGYLRSLIDRHGLVGKTIHLSVEYR